MYIIALQLNVLLPWLSYNIWQLIIFPCSTFKRCEAPYCFIVSDLVAIVVDITSVVAAAFGVLGDIVIIFDAVVMIL